MRLRGGYNILLEGRPIGKVEVLPDPDALYLPLETRRFLFSQLCVKEGQRVSAGQVLGRDPANHSVPLLAPRPGMVRLDAIENHVVLDEITPSEETPQNMSEDAPHVPKHMDGGSREMQYFLSGIVGGL